MENKLYIKTHAQTKEAKKIKTLNIKFYKVFKYPRFFGPKTTHPSVVPAQAYLINVVWTCYKYLFAMRRVLPTVDRPRDVGQGHPGDTSSDRLSSVQSVTAAAASSASPDAQVASPLFSHTQCLFSFP